MLQRWRWHREIERRLGLLERRKVETLSEFAFGYYIAYIGAGIERTEAMRLASLSAARGDDITNYPDLAYPEELGEFMNDRAQAQQRVIEAAIAYCLGTSPDDHHLDRDLRDAVRALTEDDPHDAG